MSRWWRAYDEAVDDPKLQRLPGDLFKAWFNIMCLASHNNGLVPPLADVAFKLRMSGSRVVKILSQLREAGLLDIEDGRLRPHNWEGRQFKSDVTDPTAAERMKQYRNKTRNTVTEKTVTVTPPRADTEKKDGANAPIEEPDPEADLFNRGKKVLGKEAGGLIAKLLKANGGSIPKTRAVIEVASTKSNPKEYVGGALRRNGSVKPEDRDWTEAVGFSSENIPWQESIG